MDRTPAPATMWSSSVKSRAFSPDAAPSTDGATVKSAPLAASAPTMRTRIFGRVAASAFNRTISAPSAAMVTVGTGLATLRGAVFGATAAGSAGSATSAAARAGCAGAAAGAGRSSIFEPNTLHMKPEQSPEAEFASCAIAVQHDAASSPPTSPDTTRRLAMILLPPRKPTVTLKSH